MTSFNKNPKHSHTHFTEMREASCFSVANFSQQVMVTDINVDISANAAVIIISLRQDVTVDTC